MSALATAQSPAELEGMGEGALPYLAGEIFDPEERSRSRARQRFQMLKALDGVLEDALAPDERVHFASWGLEYSAFEQLLLGLWALLLNHRALVVTDRRLLLLQIDLRRRPKVLRSQVAHGAVASVRARLLGGLVLRLRNGRRLTFTGVPRRDRARLVELLERFRAESGPPSSGVQGRQDLCPHCSVTVAGRPEACSRCHRGFKSTSSAALLSLAFPGLGDLYLGLRSLAAFELLGAGFVWLVIALAAFTPGPEQEALGLAELGVVGLVLVVVIHGPDALVARHTARKGLYPSDR